jgi:hypothetical protein
LPCHISDVRLHALDEAAERKQRVRTMGYRVAGNLHVRAGEQEQELAEERASARDLEPSSSPRTIVSDAEARPRCQMAVSAPWSECFLRRRHRHESMRDAMTVLAAFFLEATWGFRWEDLSEPERGPPHIPHAGVFECAEAHSRDPSELRQ